MSDAASAELARAAGLELAAYRRDHVEERIRRALARERVSDVRALASLLARDADARTRFRRTVAISVSGMFRDPAQFELLEHTLLPRLLESRRRVSVWSAGCADGSEMYSVAVLLERLGVLDAALLLGSDLLEENLTLARRGIYEGVVFPDGMRARLRWEQRDLLREGATPGKWRLILCRNVAIYLDPAAKQRLHASLVAALARDGFLMLGRSERIADPGTLGVERVAPHVYRRLR